jgi:hypothetical protein
MAVDFRIREQETGRLGLKIDGPFAVRLRFPSVNHTAALGDEEDSETERWKDYVTVGDGVFGMWSGRREYRAGHPVIDRTYLSIKEDLR